MKILTRLLLLLLLVILFFMLSHATNGFNKSLEAQALVATNWWPQYLNASVHHCNWPGIHCNEAGSVIEIRMHGNNLEGGLGSLDFSSFPNLVGLHLDECGVEGSIPEQIGLLSNLIDLSLLGNRLTGNLPVSLTNLTYLVYLDLSKNQLTGPIPPSYGSMLNLRELDLSTNQLNASIPNQITHLQNLRSLSLGDNNLDGPIPSKFGNLSQLYLLNLSRNSISGHIPLDIAKPRNLQHIDLSMNLMTGPITNLSNCLKLEYLDLSSNNLDGDIPFWTISHCYYCNLSHNHFTRIVPSNHCPNYVTTDLSGNNLKRPSTCPKRKKNKPPTLCLYIFIPIIFVFFFIGIGYVIASVSYRIWKDNTKSPHPKTKKHGDVRYVLNYDGEIAYEDFITATENFDLKYCIGTGGYGSVYEAKLPTGKTFALKKLHRFQAEQPAFDKSFKNEVQVLTNVRHKNIVKLYGFCLHNKCNFLVYEYMEKGSLFCALSDSELAVEVDWLKRVKIIKGVAHALAYMHHDCNPPIIHRDISTNNILLNSKTEGFVADFGAARLLDPPIPPTKQ
ncbi:putative protein kinase RLK-Pelle-LRR-XI-1 family [Helianthus anomalus]